MRKLISKDRSIDDNWTSLLPRSNFSKFVWLKKCLDFKLTCKLQLKFKRVKKKTPKEEKI